MSLAAPGLAYPGPYAIRSLMSAPRAHADAIATDTADAALISQALAGDETAFTQLMRRHKSWLYRFIRRYVQNTADAQDILQESFIAAWRGLARYDPARPFPIWLRRIALNKCRDRARRLTVRRIFTPLAALAAGTEIADPAPASDAEMIRHETLEALRDAIARLPASCRDSLILVALEGLSLADAGAILGLSGRAVEGRLRRARKQLARMMASEMQPADQSSIKLS